LVVFMKIWETPRSCWSIWPKCDDVTQFVSNHPNEMKEIMEMNGKNSGKWTRGRMNSKTIEPNQWQNSLELYQKFNNRRKSKRFPTVSQKRGRTRRFGAEHSGSDGFCHFVILKTSGEIDLGKPFSKRIAIILNFDHTIVLPQLIFIIFRERIELFWCLRVDWPKFQFPWFWNFVAAPSFPLCEPKYVDFSNPTMNIDCLCYIYSYLVWSRLGNSEIAWFLVCFTDSPWFECDLLPIQVISLQFDFQLEFLTDWCFS
jgi:hypothetical protein